MGNPKIGSITYSDNTKQAMEKLVYSIPEIAALLGISNPTAYELANRADFPILHVGRRKVVPRAAFLEWLAKSSAPKAGRGEAV